MEIRRRLIIRIIGGDIGVWHQKQVILPSDFSLGVDYANLIAANVPSAVTFVIIVNDNLDNASFVNNQLVYGGYDKLHSACNAFVRYRNNTYSSTSGTSEIWTNTYALTGLQGDTYTLFYKED